jgi:hypothetical protein
MASLRKRYQDRVESSDGDGPPVATAPLEAAAKPPEPVADADKQPVEMPATESDAVAEAERAALRQRLAEMDRAATITQQANQQPRLATEPQRPQPEVPAQVREWLEANPHYLNDPVHAAELQLATVKCVRDGKSWDDSDFIETIERHLGNGHVHESRQPSAAPRNTVQQRPVVQRQSAAVSAPPSRDVPSFSTGKPTNGPVRLTAAQVEIARSLGISEGEYAKQLTRMNGLKSSGVIPDGQ